MVARSSILFQEDFTPWDVATVESVEKKHLETADWAINGAVEELIKELKERDNKFACIIQKISYLTF
jgi:hypothetical protein